MLSKTLAAGLTALTIAATSAIAFSTPSSAASLTFSFGPDVTTYGMYQGHRHPRVCHTKYKWVNHHKVRVGNECHWR
jgi:hypothetical protein